VEIEVGNVWSRADEPIPKAISDELACIAPGAQYTLAFKRKRWDGKVRFISDAGRIPSGYLPALKQHIPSIRFSEKRNIPRPNLQATTVPVREYQWEAITKFFKLQVGGLWFPRGVLRMPTGSGKTETAVAMVEMANVPTVMVVHRKDLLYQAAARFQKYGLPVGMLGDNQFDFQSSGITIAMIQTLHSRQKALTTMFKSTQFLIVDEAHNIAAKLDKGNQFINVLNQFTAAYMRLGLTATPFMRDEYSNFLLEGACGPLYHDLKTRTLIQMGYLQDAKVTMLTIPAIDKGVYKGLRGQARYAQQYAIGIEHNEYRNALIREQLKRLPGPTLCLVRTLAHGRAVAQDVPFISGKAPVKERQEALRELVRTKGALVSTTIFDEGLDVPELQSMILAAGGKSRGRSLQRIGRGLRRAEYKTTLNVVDFFDETDMLRKHSQERKSTWLGEGFEVEII